ncbi:MAG: hypothetical protein IJU79_02360 [Desulfovibrionaceae bacterium]|nr:hypothetical protein [Desulfovibrionaceae bacterium]
MAKQDKNKKAPEKEADESRPRPVDKSPIYNTARQLNASLVKAVAQMDKRYRYQTGSQLLHLSLTLSMVITRTYRAYGNIPEQLNRARQIGDTCDMLVSMLQAAYDCRVIWRAHFVEAINFCVSIQKQAAGWVNSIAQSAK